MSGNQVISKNHYYMELADLAATQSVCLRASVGAVIVVDSQVVSIGYNGPPGNISNCTQETCLRNKYKVPSGERIELCRGLHAEQDAIAKAAKHGVSVKNGSLYCSFRPCVTCIKMIIAAGITKVYYRRLYNDELGLSIAAQAGLPLIRII